MFHIVLVEPEIPPNTGNVIRLCANTGSHLHLIKPLGFDFEDKQLRRAGLDYHEFASVQLYENFSDFMQQITPVEVFGFSTRGTKDYTEVEYPHGSALVFGSETRGLSQAVREIIGDTRVLRIPMQANSRSLNLSNTVAIAVYEAWRQHHFTPST